jgi:hypothetical protein
VAASPVQDQPGAGNAPKPTNPEHDPVNLPNHVLCRVTQGKFGMLPLSGHLWAIALTVHTPQYATVFNSSVGVNLHTDFYGGVYDNVAQWMPLLVNGGFKHVRTNWSMNDPRNDAVIEEIASNGIDVMITSDWILSSNTNPQDVAQYIAANPALNASLTQIEGPNEVNGTVANWQTVVPAFMKQLFAAIRGNPATAHIRVVAPGFNQPENTALYNQLGNLSASINQGDIHDTPNGNYGEHNATDAWLTLMMQNEAIVAANKLPYVNSEFGYSNGTDNAQLGHTVAIPQALTANMIMHEYLEDFTHRAASSDAYELVDEGSDGAYENSFGLVDSSFNPKIAYNAVSSFTSLLADNGGTNFALSPMSYSLANTGTNTREILLQKSDGSMWLVVWEQAQVWDPSTKQPVASTSRPLLLTLAGKFSGHVYIPEVSGVTPAATFNNTTTVSLTSSTTITVVQILPSGSTAMETPPR